MAATVAGIAVVNLGGTGLIHDTAHQLGSAFHIAHGRCNALMLNSVLGFLFPRAEARIGEVAQALGIPAEDGRKAIKGLLAALNRLKEEIGMPHSIREAGVDRDRFMSLLDRLSANAISTSLKPGRASQEEIREIFLRAWEGSDPL